MTEANMPDVSQQEVVDAFEKVLKPGQDVLIHASLGLIGHLEAGPEGMIGAILDAMGPDATLVMMADTRSFAKTGRFSLDQPSETGLLTEVFRTMDGVRRSAVPMVSFCAIGPRAEDYTQPYHSHLDQSASMSKILEHDGAILLIGVGYEKCTLYHLSEERMLSPYNFYKEFAGVLIEDGKEKGPISQRYFVRKSMEVKKDPSVAGRMLEDAGKARIAPLGNGVVCAFDARDFDQMCMDALANDPEAFIEHAQCQ